MATVNITFTLEDNAELLRDFLNYIEGNAMLNGGDNEEGPFVHIKAIFPGIIEE